MTEYSENHGEAARGISATQPGVRNVFLDFCVTTVKCSLAVFMLTFNHRVFFSVYRHVHKAIISRKSFRWLLKIYYALIIGNQCVAAIFPTLPSV